MGRRYEKLKSIIWDLEDELAFFQTFYDCDEHADACIADIETDLDRLYEAARPDRDRIWRDQESGHGFAMQICADRRRQERSERSERRKK